MKAILPQGHRRWRLEALRYVAFLFVHYAFFWTYLVIILFINIALGQAKIDDFLAFSTDLYYSALGAPLVSWAMHIIYEERGLPWFRFLMFWHMMANAIAVPAIVFS